MTDLGSPLVPEQLPQRPERGRDGVSHRKATKLATTANEVIQMKTWKMKMPQRKTDYKTLKQAAEAIGGGD